MDILAWIQTNSLALFLPILSGFLAWFFSRNREVADIKRTKAEETKTYAETAQINVVTNSKVIEDWVKLNAELKDRYDQVQHELILIKAQLLVCQESNNRLESVVNYLLFAMDTYNPDISKTARQMLEKS
jgi:hypothetical protein